MKAFWNRWKWLPTLLLGCVVFALGFNTFFAPNAINCGGISGLAQVWVKWTGLGSVGLVTVIINIPLFIIGGKKLGKRFFVGSLIGMLAMSLAIDYLNVIPVPPVDPLLGALYGGVVTGAGMGLVYMSTASSGGTDIIVRLVKRSFPNASIGRIALLMDLVAAVLMGIVLEDFSKTLYSGVALFVCSKIIDAVLYSFDNTKVALIITSCHEAMGVEIDRRLGRGVTLLKGQGFYKKQDTMVLLSAIKRQQVAELKELATQIDPDAFIILQEAHQVLGDGFRRYNRDDL